MSDQRIIYPTPEGGVAIIVPSPEYLQDHTIEELAEKDVPSGITYEIVPASSIPSDRTFRNAWEFSTGEVVVDFTKAQEISVIDAKAQTGEEQQAILDGYTSEVLAAQAVLPEESRDPVLQEKFGEINDLNTELQVKLAAIQSATDVGELYAIVEPPTGILFTGRGSGLGPEDLNVSYYVEFNSAYLTGDQTELYVPGTDTVIPYVVDPETGNGSFDSAGNCFNVGDYLIQIRQVSNSVVIAEFDVPLNPAGENVVF
jgi:hypothetical protein